MDDDLATIRSQMNQTRTDLSEKLESLESRVSDGMQSTGAVVADTMTSVRDAVQSVSQTLDLRRQVQQHPWLAVGASFALGCLVARLSSSKARQTVDVDRPTGASPQDRLPTSAGLFGSLAGVLRDAVAVALPLALNRVFPQSPAQTASTEATAPEAANIPLAAHALPGPGRPLNRQFGTARSL